MIRSVLRASKFSVSKLLEIVILWVYYTIPFGLRLFRYFRDIIFNFRNHFVWLRITDEGSLPEMRIWSILSIKSDLKWCIHLSRSLFLYLKQNYLRNVKEKKEEIWISFMTKTLLPTENSQKQYVNVKTPPKTSITQRLRVDLGQSVGLTKQPYWCG